MAATQRDYRCPCEELKEVIKSVNPATTGETTLSPVERASLTWLRAKASTHNGQCVEVASIRGKIVVRDSKDPDGQIVFCTPTGFKVFLESARNGEFDNLI